MKPLPRRQLDLIFRSWGGRRPGAGRPRRPGRPRVPHDRRTPHEPRCPAHVTLRALAGVPALRNATVFPYVRAAIGGSSHAHFRILHFSVQADHLHLLVEADAASSFVRGCQGLAIRLAKAVNRTVGRRGRVWGDRYHARLLRTPREVRAALVYVLQNWRKHVPGASGLDPRASAAWFDGWRSAVVPAVGASPVRPPGTWLARSGWRRRLGSIAVSECPVGTSSF